MIKKLWEKWKASQAANAEARAEHERKLKEANGSRVEMHITIHMMDGTEHKTIRRHKGWGHRSGLGDEFKMARDVAMEFFKDYSFHVSQKGWTTPDRMNHYPPIHVARIELAELVDY
jgi:hypothetical protein